MFINSIYKKIIKFSNSVKEKQREWENFCIYLKSEKTNHHTTVSFPKIFLAYFQNGMVIPENRNTSIRTSRTGVKWTHTFFLFNFSNSYFISDFSDFISLNKKKEKFKMVYESDFYTTRRPYSRPSVSTYSVTVRFLIILNFWKKKIIGVFIIFKKIYFLWKSFFLCEYLQSDLKWFKMNSSEFLVIFIKYICKYSDKSALSFILMQSFKFLTIIDF